MENFFVILNYSTVLTIMEKFLLLNSCENIQKEIFFESKFSNLKI